ncbi:MAG TPA: NAD(+) kinase [Gammaproteobacteria bacterium]|nr:NAD(+) kinase [Gammaproteobacteria bacterium]
MANTFKCIGLIGKYADSTVLGTIKILSDYLKGRQLEVILDESTAQLLPGHGLKTASRAAIGASCDLAIVIGGDGTLLNAARSLISYEICLLGINQGRLGFLADISPHDMIQKLDSILQGIYLEEQRIMLHARIERAGQCISESDALNDVAVHKWNVARMIEVQTYINGQFVHTHRSDGIIVSTPTGSTAYALSSGGPILHPALNAIVLVPVSPHTMSNRPIVVDGDSQIEIIVKDSNQSHAQVTCDGQINLSLASGDIIKVRKKDQRVRLIHPADHDHYKILRAKLHWGGEL